jgi:hypothetical protein
MPIIRRSVLLAGFAGLLSASVLGSAAGVTPTSPNKDQTIGKSSPQPVPEDPATSGSSTEPLSDKLDRQGGIIHPPGDVDPGMTQAPPAIGSQSTPVIPPPGSPGGKPGINPK